MKIGNFLETLPSEFYLALMVLYLVLGVWAYRKAAVSKLAYAPAFLLYVLTQAAFIAMHYHLLRVNTTLVFGSVLLAVMVIWIVVKAQKPK
jgi:hypothetical protein